MYALKLNACALGVNGRNLVTRAFESYGYKWGENEIVENQA